MDENRREAERYSVSLYVERVEPVETKIHIRNLSATGFLVSGNIIAGQGGILRTSFRVRPASGEMRVTVRGRVMHSSIDGANSEFGIKIEGFSSPIEEQAYQDYVRELALKKA